MDTHTLLLIMKKASLILVVNDVNSNEIDHFWELFGIMKI